MQTRKTYKGTQNGIKGLWCGNCPNDVVVEEEITVYYPDEGKVFVKDNVEYGYVIQEEGVSILDFTENDKIEYIGDNVRNGNN